MSFAVGDKHTVSVTVQQEKVTLFAEVAGDPNPIHQDNEVARAVGLPGAIAHGMYIYGYLLQCLDTWLFGHEKQSGERWELSETKCRFHQYVLIGGTFEATVDVLDKKDNEAKVSLTFTNDKNERLTAITATIKKA